MTTPIDMIKTRLMLQRESKKAGNYKNGLHCAYQVFDLPFFLLSFVLHRKFLLDVQIGMVHCIFTPKKLIVYPFPSRLNLCIFLH